MAYRTGLSQHRYLDPSTARIRKFRYHLKRNGTARNMGLRLQAKHECQCYTIARQNIGDWLPFDQEECSHLAKQFGIRHQSSAHPAWSATPYG